MQLSWESACLAHLNTGSDPNLYTLGMVIAYTGSLSSRGTRIKVQGHSWLYTELEARLIYTRHRFKNTQNNPAT